jgi:hypothetical protein
VPFAGADARWRIEGGVLVCDAPDPPAPGGWLLTDRDYSDFVLRLEFQVASGSGAALAPRLTPGAPKPLLIPLQDDLAPVYAGTGPQERTGALAGIAGRRAELRQASNWNDLEVEVRGWSLRVAVNGKETVTAALNAEPVIRYLEGAPNGSGRVGLRPGRGRVRFRNLSVRDLSAVREPLGAGDQP